MSEFRVAICGAFDVENYGDLLFPEILGAALGARGLDVDLVEFSPTSIKPRITSPDRAVHALIDLDRLHAEKPFDAVVVGGGALVHAFSLEQALDGRTEIEDYPIYDTWVLPALFCEQRGVPLLWNVPDVPYEFPRDIARLALGLVETASYISVRNASSRANLLALGVADARITVCPDSALSLAAYFTPSESAATLEDPYFVVHINRFLDDDDVRELARIVTDFGTVHALTPVLLPLSNTHLDHEALARLQQQLGIPSRLVEPASINEMAAVVGGASLYVGVSYHGAITAIVAGVAAIAFNFMRYGKTTDLFSELGLEGAYVEDVHALDHLMSGWGAPDGNHADERLAVAVARIEAHFDTIARAIRDHAGRPPSGAAAAGGGSIRVLHGLVANAFATSQAMTNVQPTLEHVSAKMRWLEDFSVGTSDYLRSKAEWLEGEVTVLGQSIRDR